MHDVDNLYVADASFFVSNSAGNPSLTIMRTPCEWPTSSPSGSMPTGRRRPRWYDAGRVRQCVRMASDLTGRSVPVTGAASGIGRTSALAFAAAGARVAAADVDAGGLAELGQDVLPVRVDVRDPESFEAMVIRVVAEFGRLDVAHNNAGVAGSYQPLWEYTRAQFAEVLKPCRFSTC
jgi:hypothetical protein